MEKKAIDAVGMTRRIRKAHAEQLKDASVEERVAFYRDRARQLHEQLAKEQPPSGPAALRGTLSGVSNGFERDPDREF